MPPQIFGLFLLSGEVEPLDAALRKALRRRLVAFAAGGGAARVRITVAERVGAQGAMELVCRALVERHSTRTECEGAGGTAREAVARMLEALEAGGWQRGGQKPRRLMRAAQ